MGLCIKLRPSEKERKRMRQKTILVLFGGCSTEHDISLQSAQGVLEHMDRSRWLPLMVGITCQG